MSNAFICKKFRQRVSKFFYLEKSHRGFELFVQDKEKIEQLDYCELYFEYIKTKCDYAERSSVTAWLLKCLAIIVLLSVWNVSLDFMNAAISISDMMDAKIVFGICIPPLLFISAMLIVGLVVSIKDMNKVYRRLAMYEIFIENAKKTVLQMPEAHTKQDTLVK